MLKFSFGEQLMVAPTLGLDAEIGRVRVVLVGTFDAVQAVYPADAFLTGDEATDAELKAAPWYCFQYLNESLDDHWGICCVPESALDELVAAGRGAR